MVSAFGTTKNVCETRSYYCLIIVQYQIISLFCVSSIRDTHLVAILNNYTINILELCIMPPPGWHDYRPGFNSLNRPHFHCWAESQSDWLRGVLLGLGILQGRQQRQWNSVDETACVGFMVTAHTLHTEIGGPLTHKHSLEASNLIWLLAAHYDRKVDILHKKTSQ